MSQRPEVELESTYLAGRDAPPAGLFIWEAEEVEEVQEAKEAKEVGWAGGPHGDLATKNRALVPFQRLYQY
jgi:hypothetical protein